MEWKGIAEGGSVEFFVNRRMKVGYGPVPASLCIQFLECHRVYVQLRPIPNTGIWSPSTETLGDDLSQITLLTSMEAETNNR